MQLTALRAAADAGRRDQLDYAAFLQILLADEVSRRDNHNLECRLQKAGFEEVCRRDDWGMAVVAWWWEAFVGSWAAGMFLGMWSD